VVHADERQVTGHLTAEQPSGRAQRDGDFWNANKLSDEAGAWPVAPTAITPGPTTRTLTVFNDTLRGTRLDLTWTLRAGSADGPVVETGHERLTIELGGRQQLPITFDAPAGAQDLHLELQVAKPGEGVLFQDALTTYRVQAP
jgi:hypothetical protein